jgi:hypothetical protein
MSDPTYLQPPVDRSVKIPHLVFGLLFLGVAAVWALVASEAINADRLPILAPAVLIVAGVIGLAVSLASGRNRRRTGPAPEVAYSGYDSSTESTTSTEPTDPTNHAVTDDDDHTEEIR